MVGQRGTSRRGWRARWFVVSRLVLGLLILWTTAPPSFPEEANAGTLPNGNPRYSTLGGDEVELTLDPSRIAVRFAAPSSTNPERSNLFRQHLRETGFLNSELSPLPMNLVLVESNSTGPSEEEKEDLLRFANERPEIESATRIYTYRGRIQIPTGTLLVGFEDGVLESQIESLCRAHHLAEEGPLEGIHGRKLTRRSPVQNDLFELLERISSSPWVRFAEPELLFQPLSSEPSDPQVATSWHISNEGELGGTPDADPDILEAWNLESGDSGIVVAILDEGVDLDHEDLAARVVGGYDLTDQANSPPESMAGNAGPGEPHGTACAGIALATGNNDKGGAGVAFGCSLLSVRIARRSSGAWTTNDWAAAGIQKAWRGGADVLSCSWGGGTPSSLIDLALTQATNQGRGGLGCVIVFAAGNEGLAIEYPASRAETIAVGATSFCDDRKTTTSCDGEDWWASNYGYSIDVVAPGVRVRTTDLMGSDGYTSSNYTATMNGTSASTPLVAGIAALMLSRNPLLHTDEVRQILRRTADDLVGRPSEDIAGFDLFMGFGRVNAEKALLSTPLPESPTLNAITPREGPLRGGNRITLSGTNFLGDLQVTLGGVPCTLLNQVEDSIVITTPPGTTLGSVPVEVQSLSGTTTLSQSYTYDPNPIQVTVSGSFVAGKTVTLTMSGPAGANFAIAADTEAGSYSQRGFDFCFRGPNSPGFEVVKRFGEGVRLDVSGTATLSYVVPQAPIFSEVRFHGATSLNGTIEVSPCATLTVF